MPQPPTVLVNPVTKTCNPDTVNITRAHGQGVAIFFEIDPAAGNGWRWSQNPNPIVVQAEDGKFSDGGHPGGNGKGRIRLLNRNLPGDAGSYKYTAALVQDGASQPTIIDPYIQNETW
ncbi:MAG: hypothetical protein ABIV50_08575 [Opitutus sp.]